MFKRHESHTLRKEPDIEGPAMDALEKPSLEIVSKPKANAIVKGSKLTGDIIISYDLELDGEVEGNITSEQKSNIIIKGTCSGNISTSEGNVDIEGKMRKGDIYAGGDIKIAGSFNGGRVESKGTIYVNGEFSGRLEGKDIEIGPAAKGKGELFYKDNISIAKGARVEVNINRHKEEKTGNKKTSEPKVVALDRTVQEKKELKNQANDK